MQYLKDQTCSECGLIGQIKFRLCGLCRAKLYVEMKSDTEVPRSIRRRNRLVLWGCILLIGVGVYLIQTSVAVR